MTVDDGIPERFTDAGKVNNFAETAMAWVVDWEIINGITSRSGFPGAVKWRR